jgi:hypothetical protein
MVSESSGTQKTMAIVCRKNLFLSLFIDHAVLWLVLCSGEHADRR